MGDNGFIFFSGLEKILGFLLEIFVLFCVFEISLFSNLYNNFLLFLAIFLKGD